VVEVASSSTVPLVGTAAAAGTAVSTDIDTSVTADTTAVAGFAVPRKRAALELLAAAEV
jgi:hypothetical protein